MKTQPKNVLAQFFGCVFYLMWRKPVTHRPQVYEYRGSMSICISLSIKGESQ